MGVIVAPDISSLLISSADSPKRIYLDSLDDVAGYHPKIWSPLSDWVGIFVFLAFGVCFVLVLASEKIRQSVLSNTASFFRGFLNLDGIRQKNETKISRRSTKDSKLQSQENVPKKIGQIPSSRSKRQQRVAAMGERGSHFTRTHVHQTGVHQLSSEFARVDINKINKFQTRRGTVRTKSETRTRSTGTGTASTGRETGITESETGSGLVRIGNETGSSRSEPGRTRRETGSFLGSGRTSSSCGFTDLPSGFTSSSSRFPSPSSGFPSPSSGFPSPSSGFPSPSSGFPSPSSGFPSPSSGFPSPSSGFPSPSSGFPSDPASDCTSISSMLSGVEDDGQFVDHSSGRVVVLPRTSPVILRNMPFGIENNGSNCYMISMLQLLASEKTFIKRAIAKGITLAEKRSKPAKGNFPMCLGVMEFLEGNGPNALQPAMPSELTTLLLELVAPYTDTHGYADVSELLLLLINAMDTELENFVGPNTPLKKLMQIHTVTDDQSPSPRSHAPIGPVNPEVAFLLVMPIPPSHPPGEVTIEKLFRFYAFNTKLANLPQLLILHFCLFETRGAAVSAHQQTAESGDKCHRRQELPREAVKKDARVRMGPELVIAREWLTTDLAEYLFVNQLTAKYDLMAFSSHGGSRIDTGHYITGVRVNDLKSSDYAWFLCDDTKVYQEKLDNILSKPYTSNRYGVVETFLPYVAFYRKNMHVARY